MMHSTRSLTDAPRTFGASARVSLGWWTPSAAAPGLAMEELAAEDLAAALAALAEPLTVVETEAGRTAVRGGSVSSTRPALVPSSPAVGWIPPLLPAQLGESSFCTDYGRRLPYVTGSMANGIASTALVKAISRAGMLGFFGSAGLPLERVAEAIDDLQRALPDQPFGINLIHSPNEPELESAVVDLLLQRRVGLIEASAFLDLTLPVVRYRVTGLSRRADGSIAIGHRVMAKVSRIEVARKFLSPPPEKMLAELLRLGQITPTQADCARQTPMCDDLTAEADSGGHTDNRPSLALTPTLLALRDQLAEQYRYAQSPRVGAAGGIATPASVAAAFALGAAYVVTGTINQACVESGSSDVVRQMLAEAEQPDVAMAPAADMFEMGVKVQVLKRGTMFAMRAGKLYEWYRKYACLEAMEPADRQQLESQFLKTSVDEVWRQTQAYFARRDRRQIDRAEADPKHRMALVFRWYLGQSSRWANAGEPTRRLDYQVWCGPAMGAFNEWTAGTFLAQPAERHAAVVAGNLMVGAAILTRAHLARMQGVAIPPAVTRILPRPWTDLQEYL